LIAPSPCVMFNRITKINYDSEDRKGLVVEAYRATEQRTSGVILYDKVGNPYGSQILKQTGCMRN